MVGNCTPIDRIGVRYRTADLVRPAHDGLCACGRYDQALEGGILGRTDDMIVVRGVNIYPSALEQIVNGCPAVTEYRVRLLTARTLPELEVEVETLPGREPATVVAELEAEFDRALRLRVPVSVVPPGTLPRAEGKSKRFIRVE